MHLSLQTDFALRILMALAATNRQMSVDEIASSYGISSNHLSKVAQRLQAHGYIVAQRGRNGGLNLFQEPGDILLGTVVRQFENLGGLVECMDPETSHCPVAGGCGLQGALSGALGAFMAHLDGYTLADLVPQKQRFKTLLGVE